MFYKTYRVSHNNMSIKVQIFKRCIYAWFIESRSVDMGTGSDVGAVKKR